MTSHIARRCAAAFAGVVLLLSATGQARAQTQPDEKTELRKEIELLKEQNRRLQEQLEALEKRVEGLPTPDNSKPPPQVAPPVTAQPTTPPATSPATPTSSGGESPAPGRALTPREALDAALAQMQGPSTAPPATTPTLEPMAGLKLGPATLKLIDVSMVIDVAAGWSSEPDPSLQTLQGGDHDPRKRGFTLQAAELAVAGAVDPYFTAAANINYNIDAATGESNVELEEAYATTSSLPFGLQVKAGQYFTEFGLLNPTHPHTWDWMDQPVILTRLFGGDGERRPGARVAWLMPFVPWYSQLSVGVQNADGGTMPSFLSNADAWTERPIGNRPFVGSDVSGLGDLVWSARWENSFELTRDTTLKFGVSGVTGPNATGPDARTNIYGADFKLKWRAADNEQGWPFFIWQSEVMARDYKAAAFADAANPANDLSEATLHDWGFYTQALWGFHLGWAAGLRYEYAGGSGDSVGGRDTDPFRDNRQRISPLLVWQLSEFSRLRLQYNHDVADHLDKDADSVFLGLEVLFGAHPAHSY